MKIIFHKYHGNGNDFIIIDDRESSFKQDRDLISRLCNRRFGIGADGLILLKNADGYDFEMIYFNADGNESTMCGNGGRCIVAFANCLGIIDDKAKFLAIDGPHKTIINNDLISITMKDVNEVEINSGHCVIDTGSPHYLVFVDNIDEINVVEEGKKIRYNDKYKEIGINVNFLEKRKDLLHIRTYERGVETETLSCGTGVVAAALYASQNNILGNEDFCDIRTRCGDMRVKFSKCGDRCFNDIWLEGSAVFVFEGEVNV